MPESTILPFVQLAEAQLGLITWEQLVSLEVSDRFVARRVRSGEWSRVHRGVYAVGARPLSPLAAEMAALLAAGKGAALSHHSAARKLGLVAPRTSKIHVAIPHERNTPVIEGVEIHRSRLLDPWTCRVVWPFNVTGLGETVLDLSALPDNRWLRATVDSALRLDRDNLAVINLVLETEGRGHPGAQRLGDLLAEYQLDGEVPASALESLSMELGLATGTKPHLHYWEHDLEFMAELDLAWPKERVAVMLDGYRFHADRAHFERDRANDVILTELGWRVSRWVWRTVEKNPQRMIDHLAHAVLERRAHPPPPPRYRAPRFMPADAAAFFARPFRTAGRFFSPAQPTT